MNIPASERAELAALAGLNEQYLYQCLTGRRDMEPERAMAAEQLTGGRLKRWMVTRRWHRIWPELKDVEGAPPIPEPADEPIAKAA